MTLGIFGDSYADCINDIDEYSWPSLLYKEANLGGRISKDDSDCYGKSGTSTYWSYRNFLASRHLYDHIIFLHTFHNRWPLLPKELEGYSWNVHSHDVPGFPDELKKMNRFYYDIFDDDLLRFINYGVFRSVNEICKKEDRYLINVICFWKDMDTSITNYPVFYNINELSWNEKIVIDGEDLTMRQYVNERQNFDKRQCHLGHKNNKIFKDIMLDCLKNQKMNLNVDLFNSNHGWAGYDDSLYEIFEVKK